MRDTRAIVRRERQRSPATSDLLVNDGTAIKSIPSSLYRKSNTKLADLQGLISPLEPQRASHKHILTLKD